VLEVFLQAVLFGYGGIRLELNQIEFKPHGHLPDQATKFILHGIKYQGFLLDLIIDNEMYEILSVHRITMITFILNMNIESIVVCSK
jgi:trehalose/maltose hydrolase-like predicted phosphorylase